ncbi:MAG TPA: hypothetical protein PK992_00580 [Planctomycetaceae bacterium]|nr:hypothetical protein [Planctomycetaceae bacterium]HRA86524.1 hypothetical protein [Planctomycetaceae bacterium]
MDRTKLAGLRPRIHHARDLARRTVIRGLEYRPFRASVRDRHIPGALPQAFTLRPFGTERHHWYDSVLKAQIAAIPR